RVQWGQVLKGSARELMAVEEADDGAAAADAAADFLRDMLAGGPMTTKELKAAAEAHGHAWRTVERAKQALGVTATKEDFQGAWAWQMPSPKTANSAEDRQLA